MKDFLLSAAPSISLAGTTLPAGDLIIANNDLQIGFSDLQHQEHILIAQKGSLKELPDRGVGIENFINGGELDEMLNMIKVEFEKDGMAVSRIDYNEETGGLDYDATY